MKKAIPTVLLFMTISICFGQNPFDKFNYKPKIGTLSHGKYIEHFDNDSIVQIGSVLLNVHTGKIAGFVVKEVRYSEATLEPEIVSRWMSPDPLAQEFPDSSPYTFSNNNPIFFVDPTGLAAEGVLDDYGVDKDGNIILLRETDDNFDRLYAVNDEGVEQDTNNDGTTNSDDSIVVNDQTILPELAAVKESENSSYHGQKNLRDATRGEGSQNDLFKIFSFAADNSNVEWSLYRLNIDGETQFNLGTFGNNSVAPGGSRFDSSQLVAGIHSHPGIPTSSSEEIGSMFGDRSITTGQIRRNGQAPGLKYVYFPNSTNIYNISNTTAQPSFIRKTNGDYKRFFFGTLNTK